MSILDKVFVHDNRTLTTMIVSSASHKSGDIQKRGDEGNNTAAASFRVEELAS